MTHACIERNLLVSCRNNASLRGRRCMLPCQHRKKSKGSPVSSLFSNCSCINTCHLLFAHDVGRFPARELLDSTSRSREAKLDPPHDPGREPLIALLDKLNSVRFAKAPLPPQLPASGPDRPLLERSSNWRLPKPPAHPPKVACIDWRFCTSCCLVA